MNTPRPLLLVAGVSALLFAAQARGEIDCYGSLASYRLSHPNLNCTCSSPRSMPSCSSGGSSSSNRSTGGRYASARASMAASIFGAALEAVFADPGPSAADLERRRQQEEADRRRAEAERLAALERSRAAEQRHQSLLGALSPLPGATPAGGASPATGVRLTALDAPPAGDVLPPLPDFGSTPGFVSDEAARAWLAGPETLFAAVWKPLAVAPPLPATPATTAACPKAGQGCEITLPAEPTAVRIAAAPPPSPVQAATPAPEALRQTVGLLRPASCVSPCDDEPYWIRAWAAGLPPENARRATLLALVDRLKETRKILVESIAIMALDAVPNEGLAAGVKIIYNTRETADTVLKDALKVAGYAGTRSAPLPELISFEETAAPFAGDPEDLRKLLSGGKDRNKTLNTLVVESAWLAQKLRRVWVAQ